MDGSRNPTVFAASSFAIAEGGVRRNKDDSRIKPITVEIKTIPASIIHKQR